MFAAGGKYTLMVVRGSFLMALMSLGSENTKVVKRAGAGAQLAHNNNDRFFGDARAQ